MCNNNLLNDCKTPNEQRVKMVKDDKGYHIRVKGR